MHINKRSISKYISRLENWTTFYLKNPSDERWDWAWPTHTHKGYQMPWSLWQWRWSLFLIESLYNIQCQSMSSDSVVFIYFVHQTDSLRTSCHLMAMHYPAGLQVAKYTLLLFVWPAFLILALSPSMEWSVILLWEGSKKSRWAKSHLAAIIRLGYIQLLAVWFLFEHWWWHCSRTPPVSSSSDLCSGYAGKG